MQGRGAARRAAPRRPWLLASLLAHLAVVGAMLFLATRGPRPGEELPPPAFDIVFEGGQPERAAAEPPPGLEAPPAPPPAISAPPPPPPVPVPVAPPPPLRESEQAPPPPVPEPERPPASPAEVAAIPPPPPPPPRAAPLPAVPPQAAPPPPPPPPPPAPPRAAPPQQAAPRLPPGTFFMPEGVELGRPAQPAPPAGRPLARGLDLAVDPRLIEGRATSDPQVRVTGAQVGADWRAAFRRWLDDNIRYPRRAIELRESGTVRVLVTAAPDGTVRDVRLVGPSGSPSLNLATTMPFGGARLPAFPPPADPDGVTIELTVNYILIRR